MSQKYFLFILIALHSLSAMSQLELSSPRLSKQYFKSPVTDVKDIIIAPFSMNKTQWLTFCAVAGTGYLIYTQDLKMQQFSQSLRTPTTEAFSNHGIEQLGSRYYSGALIGLLYLHGSLAKNDRTKRVALISAKALIIISPVIFISKAAFYRDRPFDSEVPDPGRWIGIGTGLRESNNFKDFNFSTSFPSGHAATAFTIATVVACEYKDKPIIPIIAYSLATLTGISRIHDNKHWASDVFAGAVVGYALGKLIYNKNNAGFTLAPYKIKNETGFYFSMPIKGKA